MSLNTHHLLQLSGENFGALLKSIGSEKVLFLDPGILKPLDKIMGMSLLREAGVKTIHRLDQAQPGSLPNPSVAYVFLLFPTLESVGRVQDIIHTNDGLANANVTLVFIPKICRQVSLYLEENGILDRVRLYEFHWEFVPLETHLWSMLLPPVQFYEKAIQSDVSNYLMLKCLHSVQMLFGRFRSVSALGSQACALAKQLTSKALEEGLTDSSPDQEDALDHLIVMDRSLDLLPALLTPLTYEALIHQVFPVTCGQIELERAALGGKKAERTTVHLSNKDTTFASIRYKPFTSIFSFLSSNARRLKEVQSSAASMSVKEMKSFVQSQLKDLQTQYQSISMHISLSETIQRSMGHLSERSIEIENGIVHKESGIYSRTMAFLQEAMARDFPLIRIKCIICLLHLCSTGIPSPDMSQLRKQILESYGYQEADNVHKFFLYLNSVKERCISKSCIDTRAILKSHETESNHPSYVFGGLYQPLICTLVGKILSAENLNRDIPKGVATFFDKKNIRPPASRPTVIVLFLGGLTYAEIAALKVIERNTGSRIIVASDIDLS